MSRRVYLIDHMECHDISRFIFWKLNLEMSCQEMLSQEMPDSLGKAVICMESYGKVVLHGITSRSSDFGTLECSDTSTVAYTTDAMRTQC